MIAHLVCNWQEDFVSCPLGVQPHECKATTCVFCSALNSMFDMTWFWFVASWRWNEMRWYCDLKWIRRFCNKTLKQVSMHECVFEWWWLWYFTQKMLTLFLFSPQNKTTDGWRQLALRGIDFLAWLLRVSGCAFHQLDLMMMWCSSSSWSTW